MRNRTRNILLFSVAALLVVSILVFGATSWLLLRQLRANNTAGALQTVRVFQPLAQTASWLTAGQVPVIEAAAHCPTLISLSEELGTVVPTNSTLVGIDLAHLKTVTTQNNQSVQMCLSAVSNSSLLQSILPYQITQFLPEIEQQYTGLTTVLDELTATSQTWLILFQNSDELRATGGFTGSYALLTITDGVISELVFEDIYDADGQFQGYVTAPPGVAEYLSSNNGLRLPDANWHPDVPQSVRQQLDFFALGRKQGIAGVITINLPLAERLLQVTGPISIPDYQTFISAQNLHQALREERDPFFAGAIQKKHILSQVVKQAILKLSNLPARQQLELIEIFKTSAQQKELLAFSRNQTLQELFAKWELTGAINTQHAEYFFGLVESNVGINKANRQVQRTVKLELQERRSLITITFANNNSPDTPVPENGAKDNGYVNYQRLLIPPSWQVRSVSTAGEELETWQTDTIATSFGQQLQQVGYLVPVPEQTTRTTTIELTHPPLAAPSSLQLYKQPGLAATPYTITFGEQTQQLLLEHDQVIVLE